MKRNKQLACRLLKFFRDNDFTLLEQMKTDITKLPDFSDFDSIIVKYHYDMLGQHDCFIGDHKNMIYPVPLPLSWIGHDLLEFLEAEFQET